MWKSIHHCDGTIPACVPYLERVEQNAIRAYKNGYRTDPYPERKVPADDYGIWLQIPMGGEFRDMLKEDGYRMVHLCWPGPSEYWYIFQKVGAKKATCGICNTKFSLAFPTTGKQVR